MKGQTEGRGVFKADATKTSRRKIKQELIKHGATKAQAHAYCNLVDYFVDLSKQDCVTERHHILPRESGWWKRFEHAKWNIAVISWQLHGSLHAVLCHIFPTNEAMFHAARITSSSFRGNEKKLRLKPEIIRLYQAGKGCPQISKKLGLGQTAINHWLREWGIGIRSSGEARGLACVGNKKEMCKEEIIGLYETKKNCSQIGKKFGLDNGTIGRWLREWGVKIRSRSEAVSLSKIGNKKEMCKEEIIRLYLSGKTTVWIGKKFGLTDSTIGRWLHERHIPIRKKHTAESRAKMRVAQAGKNHPMFGKKHSAETRAKMSLARKAYHSQNPDVAA